MTRVSNHRLCRFSLPSLDRIEQDWRQRQKLLLLGERSGHSCQKEREKLSKKVATDKSRQSRKKHYIVILNEVKDLFSANDHARKRSFAFAQGDSPGDFCRWRQERD